MIVHNAVRTTIVKTGEVPAYTDHPFIGLMFRIDALLSHDEHRRIREAAVITGVVEFKPVDDSQARMLHTMFMLKVPATYSPLERQHIVDLFVRRANVAILDSPASVAVSASFSHKR